METLRKETRYKEIINSLNTKFDSNELQKPADVYKSVVTALAEIPYFHWTGIYLLDETKNALYLDFFIGAETEHTHIPVGQGVCGSAVVERTDKIIKDVREESNYLACSVGTLSEIVVLIEDNNRILGQIDIDSDELGVFDTTDQKYLRKISQMIVNKLSSFN